MSRVRRGGRDFVLWAVLTGGIVAFVLGRHLIGLALCALAIWQFALVYWGKGGLFVDQRAADKEGPPRIRPR